MELDAWRLTFVGGGGGFRTRNLHWTDVDQRIPAHRGVGERGWKAAGDPQRPAAQVGIAAASSAQQGGKVEVRVGDGEGHAIV